MPGVKFLAKHSVFLFVLNNLIRRGFLPQQCTSFEGQQKCFAIEQTMVRLSACKFSFGEVFREMAIKLKVKFPEK